MTRRVILSLAKIIGVIGLLTIIFLVSIPPLLYYNYRQKIFVSVTSIPRSIPQTVMVLGAAVYPNDTPSNALQDRLEMAHSLYKHGNVEKILVSGAKDEGIYNEPRAMKATLVELGVPAEIIWEDDGGSRTFESCRRAKEDFGFDSLLVVSQGFHLPRALFLCEQIGLRVAGIYATGAFSESHSDYYTVREIAAMYLAVWDIIRYKRML